MNRHFPTAFLRHGPWSDRTGTLSSLRIGVLVLLTVPALTILWHLSFGPASPEPFEHVLHESGEWAIRFLVLTLCVTPTRRIFRWNRLMAVRRMIGVSVVFYGVLHFGFYLAQQNWDLLKVASEIALRFYLTIGFAALCGLAVLGATSFDSAIQRLGRTWTRLHWLVYPIAVLGIWHYFLQSKSDVSQPVFLAGLFALLMIYRGMNRYGFRLDKALPLLIGAVLGAAASATVEYAWYALATGIPAHLVFLANFDVAADIRPAVWVGIIGLSVAGIKLCADFLNHRGYSQRVSGRPGPGAV